MNPVEPTKYVYCFVRQDLSCTEQQGVQTGHVMMKAGEFFGNGIWKSHMVWIGVPNKAELIRVLEKAGMAQIAFVTFEEEDNNEGMTALCTDQIWTNKDRNVFKEWDLLQHANTVLPEVALT